MEGLGFRGFPNSLTLVIFSFRELVGRTRQSKGDIYIYIYMYSTLSPDPQPIQRPTESKASRLRWRRGHLFDQPRPIAPYRGAACTVVGFGLRVCGLESRVLGIRVWG